MMAGPMIDYGKCIGCRICIEVCPKGVYALKDGKKTTAIVGGDECVECGACAMQCTQEAIIFMSGAELAQCGCFMGRVGKFSRKTAIGRALFFSLRLPLTAVNYLLALGTKWRGEAAFQATIRGVKSGEERSSSRQENVECQCHQAESDFRHRF